MILYQSSWPNYYRLLLVVISLLLQSGKIFKKMGAFYHNEPGTGSYSPNLVLHQKWYFSQVLERIIVIVYGV